MSIPNRQPPDCGPPLSGDAIVIMINTNDNDNTLSRIAKSIAAKYQMSGFPFP
jgi:hypothetical protein